RIRLNMSSVTYLSSAGIRILLQFYQQLHEINGSFRVIEPSPAVKRILDMTRLSPVLISEAAAESVGVAPPATTSARRIEHEDAAIAVLEYQPGAPMKSRSVGDAALVERGGYGEKHVRKLAFPENAIGLGLGAFGGDFADCRSRFGEFLAVAGSAAYLPTDGSNVADYMVSAGSFV